MISIVNSVLIRVRYSETDQMGVVYYGNYPQYLEVARTETLRATCTDYRSLEASGIMLPVRKLHIQYHKPARYDDLLEVKTLMKEIPSTRITFFHEIFNEDGQKLTSAEVQLVFVNMKTGRPISAPTDLVLRFVDLIRNGKA